MDGGEEVARGILIAGGDRAKRLGLGEVDGTLLVYRRLRCRYCAAGSVRPLFLDVSVLKWLSAFDPMTTDRGSSY